MADYSHYHSLGQGQEMDPNDPNRDNAPVNSPYQQQAQGYGNAQQYQYQQPLGAAPGQQPNPEAQSLSTQMGALNVGADGSSTVRKKKKDRHAYHNVEAVGSSQAFNGMPGPGTPDSQFLTTNPAFGAPAQAQGSSQFGVPGQVPSQAGPYGPGAPGAPLPPDQFAAGNASADASAPISSSGPNKVSAEDMPSIPTSRDSVQQHYLKNVYPTFERHVPPPATVSFVAFDQGNSSPKFARLTTNNIPASADGLSATGLPLGMILQPLAQLQAGEAEIPILDFGTSGPPRCRRCRAYINPFMMFRSGGNKFVCNLCTHPNETPAEYFCATSPQGVRIDRDQRPELHRGTVEFVVPQEYWTKEPVGLRWLFLIDVTQEAYNKGFIESFCDGILSALYGSEDDKDENGEIKRKIPEGAKVGFVTFDKDIHFYNMSNLEQAQMMIMPDLEDPFLPLGEGLFVDPYESKGVITALLNRLPEMFSTIKNPEPALLATLNAALAALEKTGGKIICSCSRLPTWGPGRLFLRDDRNQPGGEGEKSLYTTEHPGWKKLAEKLTSAGVGADFFLAALSGAYLDVATIGHVAATSGGESFYYPNFIAQRDGMKLSADITHAVTRETGFQALLKVRCSNGLQITAYHGSFIPHTFGADLEIGSIDADKAIGVTFGYDGKLDSKLDAHFQSALLYTTASGQRRVRCSNVIASVVETPKEAGLREQGIRECMKFVDQDAVVSLLAKEANTKYTSSSSNIKDVRNWLTERTIDVMACYRKHSAQQHPPGQLVMPERLKEFCMYMLGLIKTRAFKGGLETLDRRIYEMRMVRAMGPLELSLYIYPRMIPIHNLQPEDGFADSETGHLKMPPSIRTSFSRVEPGGVYLVDNGQMCLMWFHSQTSPNLLEDLFGPGTESLKNIDPYLAELPKLDTHLNAQVRNIMEYLKTIRGSKGISIQIARQGIDGAEFDFARMLVEDRNNEAQSYVDWLVHVHKNVQLELSGQRKHEDGQNAASAIANFTGLRPSYW